MVAQKKPLQKVIDFFSSLSLINRVQITDFHRHVPLNIVLRVWWNIKKF